MAAKKRSHAVLRRRDFCSMWSIGEESRHSAALEAFNNLPQSKARTFLANMDFKFILDKRLHCSLAVIIGAARANAHSNSGTGDDP
jgi:hypothetical protein